jgi:hypothetical protein
MIKVCFICNWGENSSQLLNKYKTQTPNNSGVWGNIQGVSNPNEADYFVIMDGGIRSLPRDKVLFFQREPSNIKGLTEDLKGVKFKGTYDTTNQASVWWVKRDYDYLSKLVTRPKQKKVSCVMSGKVMCEGHRNRLKLVGNYSREMDVDFYGRGLGSHISKGYKGQTDDKFDALYTYEYSFVFENTNTKNYFTEKICDSFLTYTMPLYNGCTNIGDYFPKESFVDIRGKSVEEIKEIIKEPLSLENVNALIEAKDLVLNKYNLWAMIEQQVL